MQNLAATARAAGVPLASHDDESPSERAMHRALGCRITEFPLDRLTAEAAGAGGDCIVMGAPNVMRGGSHAARLDAATAAADGLCAVLTSDYYYPALLQAPFRLASRGVMPLERAWALVSRNPAQAVGLGDRGSLEPGRRADLVLVDDEDPELPVVAATIVAGRAMFVDGRRAPGLLRLAASDTTAVPAE
jgi:alpha-D-ribose 1-methylphosphonate 5-triphosphate diphosphatase